jgi:G3E family GTPase
MVDAIPVTVVTGFLGAGKSTLLLRWLDDLPREQTAVIVNEQGAVRCSPSTCRGCGRSPAVACAA